ncbi:MAG: helix-turn-helix transcriptional regulator, partial [Acidimicrobiales bacterium]|nr:helix-turn-helix transcriptional regulator [Acidimicrobiales bacterium]
MTTPTRGFREPSYFVLASLLDGPRHGYGIIKQAALLSNGEVRLAPGTLYGALDRLAAAGLIQSSGQEVVAGRPRHYYRLTEVGRDSLLTEARRLAAAAAAVLDLVTAQNGVHDQ